MSRTRDIVDILSITEKNNPENKFLLDSAILPVTSSASPLQYISSLDSLPSSNLTAGDTAYVAATNRFYLSNGNGWYNVALVNVTPSLTISPSGAIALNNDGTPTTITLTGQDSDNAILTFSVESDGSFLGLGTIAQDSSVFTITPFSSDSATQTSSTLTFKVTDGVGIGSGTTALSLTFSISNSQYTTFLTKADAAATDNQVDASTQYAQLSVTPTRLLNLDRVNRVCHIMRPDDMSPCLQGQTGRGDRAGQPSLYRPPRDGTNHGFSGDTHQYWRAELVEFSQTTQQLVIVLNGLAEAKTRIDQNP